MSTYRTGMMNVYIQDNVYIHTRQCLHTGQGRLLAINDFTFYKLKLSIKYFNLNITVTSHGEKVSMFTRQISDTRLSLL